MTDRGRRCWAEVRTVTLGYDLHHLADSSVRQVQQQVQHASLPTPTLPPASHLLRGSPYSLLGMPQHPVDILSSRHDWYGDK